MRENIFVFIYTISELLWITSGEEKAEGATALCGCQEEFYEFQGMDLSPSNLALAYNKCNICFRDGGTVETCCNSQCKCDKEEYISDGEGGGSYQGRDWTCWRYTLIQNDLIQTARIASNMLNAEQGWIETNALFCNIYIYIYTYIYI